MTSTGSQHAQLPTHDAHLDVLQHLRHLVRQSLVQTEQEDEGTRYRLLESLREYAAERLAARGEADAMHRRHAEHFLALAEAADLGLRGPEQARWVARLAREYDNVQAALRWCTEQGESELAHRLVGELWMYWYSRPRGVEGAHWFERVLAMDSQSVPPAVRAKALNGAMAQALLEGNVALAQSWRPENMALFGQLGDSLDHGQSLLLAGLLAALEGKSESMPERFQEGLAMFRRLGARRGEGWALGLLGQVATFANNHERARAVLGASERILREIGDFFGLAGTLVRAGDLACRQGNLTEARAYYEDGVLNFRAAGLPLAPPTLLHNLARVLSEQGESDRATSLFQTSLELYRDRADEAGVAHCLLGLADLALDVQEVRLAARLLGAADRLPRGRPRGLLGGWVWAGERRSYEQQVALVRERLGSTAFDAAFADGGMLTPEQAAADASTLAAPPASPIPLRQQLA